MTTPFNLVGELQEENERSGNWCFTIRSPYICRSVLKSFRHKWPPQMCHTCFRATIFVRKKKPLSCQAFSEKVVSRQALLLVGPLPGRVFTEKYKFYWRLLFPWHRCTVFSQTFSQYYLTFFSCGVLNRLVRFNIQLTTHRIQLLHLSSFPRAR